MHNDESIPHPRKARGLWIGLFAPLLIAVLLLDLPLGLLYGLKAELRHLSRSNPASPADVVCLAYSTNTISPALAVNNGPEDALSPRTVDIPQSHACPVVVVEPVLFPIPVGYSSNAIVYVDSAFIRPPPRSYDPLGPPPVRI
ncbi:MAG: hypothetical protein AB7P12_01915 [Alphaproteobacteria bacterium]